MTDRLPPICTADQIRAAYHVGLRIVWEEGGVRDIWDVIAVDESSATTRFTLPDGTQTEVSATFEALSAHSAFPVGAAVTSETFDTPMGSMSGTHVVVDGGSQHFYFADDYPGPPMIISGPGSERRQVERSDCGL